MNQRFICMVIFFFIFFLYLHFLHADIPVKNEQLIYSIKAFNGKGYTGTFCRQDSKTIFLLANVDNILTVRKTLVYYWPISQDWKTDTSVLNYKFNGTLEVTGGNIGTRFFNQEIYTFFGGPEEHEDNWKILKGNKAVIEKKRFDELAKRYLERQHNYLKEKFNFENTYHDLVSKIEKAQREGKDTTVLSQKLKELDEPLEPELPTFYVKPLDEGFIINLPSGKYSLRLQDFDGKIFEGSEKQLIIFDKSRIHGIGYEIIPGDKWTRPIRSTTPDSVIYVNGNADLYIQPFFQNEYNELFYNRMIKNDSRGNANIMNWIRLQQIPNTNIVIETGDNDTMVLTESLYLVDQIDSTSLGYKIVPFEIVGKEKEEKPTLKALRIPIRNGRIKMKMMLRDIGGSLYEGGEREIRIIRKTKVHILPLIFSFLPIIFFIFFFIFRKRKLLFVDG